VSQKKPTKRRVAKATPATRRRRPRRSAVRVVDAPPEKSFWVNFGPVVKNLRELRDALATMSDMQFAHHVGAGRNDFARWVAEVLEDAECATALRRTRKRQSAVRAVEASLGARR
jgi:hypothetical protein